MSSAGEGAGPRDEALERLYELEARDPGPVEAEDRAGRLVAGVMADKDALDALIEEASDNWSVSRMPMVDRNILRMCLWELINEQETPTAVVMAEAVRLATTYSTERSAAFVNGLLASLARAVRPE